MTEYILAATMLSLSIIVIFLIKDLCKKSQKHTRTNK